MTNGEESKGRQDDLEERLIEFTLRVIEIVEALPATRIGNHIAGQLVRCGASPALHDGEARSAEFREDFVHKMKIVLNKELRETRVWLLLIRCKGLVKRRKRSPKRRPNAMSLSRSSWRASQPPRPKNDA